MADTVDTVVVFAGKKRYVHRYTNVCDGTGESGVIKLDISTLTGMRGGAVTKVGIEEISWSIQGFTSVRLFWDHTTDDEIKVLTGNGAISYQDVSYLMDSGTGQTGDVLLTTAGNTSGSTYDITVVYQLRD